MLKDVISKSKKYTAACRKCSTRTVGPLIRPARWSNHSARLRAETQGSQMHQDATSKPTLSYPHQHKAQAIITSGIRNDCIVDSCLFDFMFIFRFVLLASKIHLWDLVGVLLFGFTVQTLSNLAMVLTVSYMEKIPLDEFAVPWSTKRAIFEQLSFFILAPLFAPSFFFNTMLNIWDHNIPAEYLRF